MPKAKYVTDRNYSIATTLPRVARSRSPPDSASSMSHPFTEPITDDPKPTMGLILARRRAKKLQVELRRIRRKLADIAPLPTSECATDECAPLLD